MTHFPDLTPYAYAPSPDPAFNVGWLDASAPFPTGPTPTAFHQKLLAYCRPQYVVRRYRGVQTCPFCAGPQTVVQVGSGGEQITLGNGEIRVIGTEVVYAAPTLIYHYVVDHGYRPPQAFVEAVLAGPGPGSAEHQILVRIVEGKFRKPLREGGQLVLLSLVMFTIAGSIFGALGISGLGDYWPVLLIVLGVLILLGRLVKR